MFTQGVALGWRVVAPSGRHRGALVRSSSTPTSTRRKSDVIVRKSDVIVRKGDVIVRKGGVSVRKGGVSVVAKILTSSQDANMQNEQ
jgi:hypothetical protein